MSAFGSSVINKSGKKLAPKAPRRRPGAGATSQTTSQAASQAASPAAATPTADSQTPSREAATPPTAPGPPSQAVSADVSQAASQASVPAPTDAASVLPVLPEKTSGDAAGQPTVSGGSREGVAEQSQNVPLPATKSAESIPPEQAPTSLPVDVSIERPAPAEGTHQETIPNEPRRHTAEQNAGVVSPANVAEPNNAAAQQGNMRSGSPTPITALTTHREDATGDQPVERSPKRRRLGEPSQSEQALLTRQPSSPQQTTVEQSAEQPTGDQRPAIIPGPSQRKTGLKGKAPARDRESPEMSTEQPTASVTASEELSTETAQTTPAPASEETPSSVHGTINENGTQAKASESTTSVGRKKAAPRRTTRRVTEPSTRQAAPAASTAESEDALAAVLPEDEERGTSQAETRTTARKPRVLRTAKKPATRTRKASEAQAVSGNMVQDGTNAAPTQSDEPVAAATETESMQGGAEARAEPVTAKKARKPRKDKGIPRKGKAATAEGESQAADSEGQAEGGAEAQGGAAPRTQKPRKPRKKPTTSSAGEGTAERSAADDEGEQTGVQDTTPARKPRPKPKPKIPRKRARATTEGEHGETAADSSGQASAGAEEDSQSAPPKNRGRKGTETPEDAEETTIDPTQTTMFDLAKGRRTGQLSQREKAMREINWDEVKRKRREEEERDDARRSNQADVENALKEAERAREVKKAQSGGVKMKLVNGRMVVDNSSTHIDRRADAIEEDEDLEEVEEDDLTVRMTTRTYLGEGRKDPAERRMVNRKNKNWSEAETDAFYDALRMFGIDFFVISKLFPGKTRRHIKLKFVREERADPDRIKAALIGERVPIDFERFAENYREDQRPEKWIDPEELYAELEELNERDNEEFERQRKELMEQAKNRKAFEDGGGETEGGQPAKKGKKKGDKAKAATAAAGGGEEDVEVLETFED